MVWGQSLSTLSRRWKATAAEIRFRSLSLLGWKPRGVRGQRGEAAAISFQHRRPRGRPATLVEPRRRTAVQFHPPRLPSGLLACDQPATQTGSRLSGGWRWRWPPAYRSPERRLLFVERRQQYRSQADLLVAAAPDNVIRKNIHVVLCLDWLLKSGLTTRTEGWDYPGAAFSQGITEARWSP